MNSRDYFHRRYRLSLVAMVAGWVIGFCVFGLSYLHAQKAVQSASERAQAIWKQPEGVNPATLPEEDRLALLALIKARKRSLRKVRPLSPEEEKQVKQSPFVPDSDMPKSRADLIRQFLRISEKRAAASDAVVGDFENDNWSWLVPSDSAHGWSDEPGDDWWFVDPATRERAYRDLSSVEADIESRGLACGLALAFLFPIPWLWYFLLNRLREVSNIVRRKEN
jgi:hypothetical protein